MDTSRPERGQLLDEFPYVRVGDGPRTLLLIPGIGDALFDGEYGPLASWGLRAFLREYVDDHTVYLVSRPRGLAEGTSIRDMARDYGRVLDEELGPASVIGVSMGGLIAQDLAIDRPDLVDRLVLAVSGCRVAAESVPTIRRNRRRALERDWTALRSDLVRELYTGWRRAVYPRLSRTIGRVRPPAPADPLDAVVSIDAVLEFDSRERLERIHAPTLVIGGTDDLYFPEPVLRETHEEIPDAQLAMFREARHGAFLERKAGFDNWVTRFLTSEPTQVSYG